MDELSTFGAVQVTACLSGSYCAGTSMLDGVILQRSPEASVAVSARPLHSTIDPSISADAIAQNRGHRNGQCTTGMPEY